MGRSTRVRHLAGPGFKQAATAKEETGRAAPPERGTPRGRASSRQQRQRKGRGGPPHPNAAPHGAGLQAGSNGRGGEAAGHLTRVRRLAGPGFRRAATAGAGQRGIHRSGLHSRQEKAESGEEAGPVSPVRGSHVLYAGSSAEIGQGRGGLRTSSAAPMTCTSE
ncbi:hypothetical protein GCM10009605_37500 [Nocardiopsis composta]